MFINEFEAWHKPIFITSTGYASALQNIGVAFFWIPFLAIAHGTLVIAKLVFPRTSFDSSIATAGYDTFYFHALNFGNWLYGLVALTLCLHLSRRYFSPRATLLALFFTSLASPFFYYMTYFAPNPVMPSVLMATAFIIMWDFTRRNGHWPHWLLLGSIGGILLSLANYNVSFICFPLITLVASVRSHHTVRTTINDAIAFALGLLLGFLPQLLTWRILFGGLTIPYAGQLDWLHPRIMEVLFSTYHGLYFYAPFLLLATAGILLLGRRDRVFAFGMIAALLVQTYVSGINLAWWAGGSFGMRYLLPLTPVFVVGAASLFEVRPRVWLYVLGYLCLIWTYVLFLGFYSGGVASIEFYPLHQQ